MGRWMRKFPLSIYIEYLLAFACELTGVGGGVGVGPIEEVLHNNKTLMNLN